EQVTFLSLHRYPFYPGTGLATETGTGAGLGHTINIPLRFGISPSEYLAAFDAALEKAVAVARPDIILVSAGFDAHAEDPIGSLGLGAEDFVTMTQQVKKAAAVHSQGRVVSCLEGGYSLQRMPECVAAHLGELLRELQGLRCMERLPTVSSCQTVSGTPCNRPVPAGGRGRHR
ncbi:MAG TPA: hypothetical protein PLX97_06230, partial [Gemmatales bacterium]|nr:hypothetical protein [Gemmatales bacterium]